MDIDCQELVYDGIMQNESKIDVHMKIQKHPARYRERPRYINNSLHLPRKHARIFVRGHYLLREANSFPRA